MEWRQKGLRKEGGWEVAFPGVKGFEGSSNHTWVCVWGQGWEPPREGMCLLVPQVHHLIFTCLWVSNRNEAGEGLGEPRKASWRPEDRELPCVTLRCPKLWLAGLMLYPGWGKTALKPPVFFGCSLGSVWLCASWSGRYTPRWLPGCASPLPSSASSPWSPEMFTCCGRPSLSSPGCCWCLSAGP